jgi:hypothetical protein
LGTIPDDSKAQRRHAGVTCRRGRPCPRCCHTSARARTGVGVGTSDRSLALFPEAWHASVAARAPAAAAHVWAPACVARRACECFSRECLARKSGPDRMRAPRNSIFDRGSSLSTRRVPEWVCTRPSHSLFVRAAAGRARLFVLLRAGEVLPLPVTYGTSSSVGCLFHSPGLQATSACSVAERSR